MESFSSDVESKGPVLLNGGWDDWQYSTEDDGDEQNVPVGGSSESAG